MTDLRDDYDLPKKPPLPFRQAAVMITFVALALAAWLLAPDSAIAVGLLAVALLTAVFVGVGMVLRSRGVDEKPGREPVTPPSAHND